MWLGVVWGSPPGFFVLCVFVFLFVVCVLFVFIFYFLFLRLLFRLLSGCMWRVLALGTRPYCRCGLGPMLAVVLLVGCIRCMSCCRVVASVLAIVFLVLCVLRRSRVVWVCHAVPRTLPGVGRSIVGCC